MKRKLLFCLALSAFFYGCNTQTSNQNYPFNQKKAGFFPTPIGWVNDFVHLFSQSEISTLDSIIRKYEAETSNEIAIATVEKPLTEISIDTFATRLFNVWEIGKAKKNNGVLILICPQLRTVVTRNGYDIEAVLSDSETKGIIEVEMIPEFRKGDYFIATRKGLLALIEKIK
jgi:uncharacterized protein